MTREIAKGQPAGDVTNDLLQLGREYRAVPGFRGSPEPNQEAEGAGRAGPVLEPEGNPWERGGRKTGKEDP